MLADSLIRLQFGWEKIHFQNNECKWELFNNGLVNETIFLRKYSSSSFSLHHIFQTFQIISLLDYYPPLSSLLLSLFRISPNHLRKIEKKTYKGKSTIKPDFHLYITSIENENSVYNVLYRTKHSLRENKLSKGWI